MNPWAGYRTGLSPTPTSLLTPNWGVEVEYYPFQIIAAKGLAIDENANRSLLIRRFLALSLRYEQSYSFRQSLK